MSTHRYGEGDHPSQQIDVRSLRERLHIERLAAVAARRPAVTSTGPATPFRLTLTASARRHLVAVAVLLVLALGGTLLAAAATTWTTERRSTGYLKTCITCHGRMIDVPPQASP